MRSPKQKEARPYTLAAELIADGFERSVGHLEGLIDVAFAMRSRKKPVVHRGEVNAAAGRLGAEDARASEFAGVGFERHEGHCGRTRPCDFEFVRTGL